MQLAKTLELDFSDTVKETAAKITATPERIIEKFFIIIFLKKL